MEYLKYIIEDSTIAELLGVQNFSTNEAAILELVKNAYDASSLLVTLDFTENQLRVIDDGVGMDKDDVKDHWMHIGKSSKGYRIFDTNSNVRVQAGSKGVGRFALARLGKTVKLYSKKDGCVGVIWNTDWNESTLELRSDSIEKGTRIEITNLREKWTINKIKKLKKYLERTYHDTSMKIKIIGDGYEEFVGMHFPKPELGKNCRANIVLTYDAGVLSVDVSSDEFEDDAKQYCLGDDLNKYTYKINLSDEFEGNNNIELSRADITNKLRDLGKFSANLFFNLAATKVDKEKFLYKYLHTVEPVESGVILYRNAFSISSFEGEKDWLGLGKRSRKSPAAASHPTGAWRVRENQIAGYILIDKEENAVLQDLMNRQGLDENIYFKLFIEVVLTGIKVFERYRQSIIRKINDRDNWQEKDVNKEKRILDRVIENPVVINELGEADRITLVNEFKAYQQEEKENERKKEDLEARHRYDVRLLNSLATSGMKATSIAHEINNDRNQMEPTYEAIISALKKYDVWDIVNNPKNRCIACEDIPSLLENNNSSVKKFLSFIDAILEKVEKKQFQVEHLNIREVINLIIDGWKKDYSWINIELCLDGEIDFSISKDIFYTIFDNLILNSVQQNSQTNELSIKIEIKRDGNKLVIRYCDDGKGLSNKYLENPRLILEPHETSRLNGHGLGMWIINNTINLQKGNILNISGINGFEFVFQIEEAS